MSVSRRDFFKLTASAVGGGAIAAKSLLAEEKDDFADNYAMLNDCTKCIGCRGCQSACKKTHEQLGLEQTGRDSRYDMPLDINADNLTVIHLYKESDDNWSYVKKQCLHCNEPSCESVCPVAAFHKRDDGVVSYDKDKCIGCRYCLVACPFNAPTFEYDTPTPKVQKCDFCKDNRLAKGEEPVCASVCPRGAIKFGKRGDLLKEAKRRIKNNPNQYNTHVYGESEIGGTSVLYLAPKDISFADLGYKMYGETPPIELHEDIQHGIFKYWIPPVALYGALGLMAYNNMKKSKEKDPLTEEDQNES